MLMFCLHDLGNIFSHFLFPFLPSEVVSKPGLVLVLVMVALFLVRVSRLGSVFVVFSHFGNVLLRVAFHYYQFLI